MQIPRESEEQLQVLLPRPPVPSEVKMTKVMKIMKIMKVKIMVKKKKRMKHHCLPLLQKCWRVWSSKLEKQLHFPLIQPN